MRHPTKKAPGLTRLVPFAALVVGLGLLLACDGRPRKESPGKPKLTGSGHVAVVDLRSGMPESTVGGGFFPLPASSTYVGLIRQLGRMRDDPDVQAVFVKFGAGMGFHRAQELGSTFDDIASAGTPVFCHAHQVDNAGLWFASRACDEIWVSAAGDVPTVGIGAELSYLKGAFEKLGIVADMMAMGKYKSGGEALTRESPSEPSLRNLRATLRDLRSQWLAGLSRGAKQPEALRSHAEDGPWTPQRAKELNLITHVGFEDQALDSARQASGTRKTEIAFGPGASRRGESPVAELVRVLAGAEQRPGGRRRIVVLPAVGSITMASGGPLAGGGEGITAKAVTRTLRRLREDSSVRAIVLRIDSPGGSPLASDLIWREVMLTRQQKPVVVSIGSMAASGGYYIASAGTKVVSSPTAIVGSIGVFGGKIVLGGALEKAGIQTYPVAASNAPGAAARANHMSALTPWDSQTRERVRASMRRIYDLFVDRVAEGRGMDEQAVYETAEGAIFLATTAQKRGLVDELGGVERALAIARDLADLPEDVPVTVEGAAESIMESLLLGPEADAQDVEVALRRYHERQVHQSVLPNDQVVEALRPFSAAVAPLLQGEAVVTALPYVLTIR